jgi:hypothetical protein
MDWRAPAMTAPKSVPGGNGRPQWKHAASVAVRVSEAGVGEEGMKLMYAIGYRSVGRRAQATRYIMSAATTRCISSRLFSVIYI